MVYSVGVFWVVVAERKEVDRVNEVHPLLDNWVDAFHLVAVVSRRLDFDSADGHQWVSQIDGGYHL